MTTKWINTKKNTNNNKKSEIEGFAIFDDSYFENCTSYLAGGSMGNDFADAIRNIIEYLTNSKAKEAANIVWAIAVHDDFITLEY